MEFTVCDLCGAAIPPHEHYVVQIDVFADPQVPATSSAELGKIQIDSEISNLLDKIGEMSGEDLQDKVHRHFEYKICAACHAPFLVNPLGKPRETNFGNN